MYNKKVDISKGYELKITVKIKGHDDFNTSTNKMYVYNIDGEWKKLDVSPEKAKQYMKSVEKNKNIKDKDY